MTPLMVPRGSPGIGGPFSIGAISPRSADV